MSEPLYPKPDAKHFFDDLTADYANNVAFETTIWDLKLIFGEYSDQDKAVEWHTSMTIPWAQAKLLQYYLQINIEAYEAEHGKVRVPSSMLPLEQPPPPSESETPLNKMVYEIVRRHREKFIQELKT